MAGEGEDVGKGKGEEQMERFPGLKANPAVRAGAAGGAGAGRPPMVNNAKNFGLMRKESFGVPKIKNHKELLKGMFQKKGMPPGMSSLR